MLVKVDYSENEFNMKARLKVATKSILRNVLREKPTCSYIPLDLSKMILIETFSVLIGSRLGICLVGSGGGDLSVSFPIFHLKICLFSLRYFSKNIFNTYALKGYVWFSLHHFPSPQYFCICLRNCFSPSWSVRTWRKTINVSRENDLRERIPVPHDNFFKSI